jgi:hypothetical protein
LSFGLKPHRHAQTRKGVAGRDRDGMDVGDCLYQTQAEATAGHTAARLQTMEPMEDAFAFLRWDAGAVVADRAEDGAAVVAKCEFDARAGGRVANGIREADALTGQPSV